MIPILKHAEDRQQVYYHATLCYGSMIRRYIHSEEIQMSRCILPRDKQIHQKNIEDCRAYEKVWFLQIVDYWYWLLSMFCHRW